jgi:hypothetical protein
MKVLPITLLVIPLLAGCGTNGPVPIGPDTYMDSGTAPWSWSSGGDVESGLYQESSAYCAKQGRVMQPLSQNGSDADFGRFAHGQIQFRCLAQNDPEVHRPAMKPVPNAVISIQQ